MNPSSQSNNQPKRNSEQTMQSVTSSNVRDGPTPNTAPNGAVSTQTNFEEHQLLYNVLQQLTRKVQERDQLNEVLQQENDKLKLMLMSALDYCYSEMGEPHNGQMNITPGPMEHFETSPSYPRKNSGNEYASPRISSSNSSSRKSSVEDNYDPNSPRRNSSGISPRQDQSPRRSSHGQDYEYARRRSSANSQYQQLENYSMTRKSAEQPSFEAIPERKRSSSSGMPETYVKRPSQDVYGNFPTQDVYGNLGNYKMGSPAPQQFEQEPVPQRRASAVPMPQQSYNLDNYVMGRPPQPQPTYQQQPPQPQYDDYRYQQAPPQQYPPQRGFEQSERKRSSSNTNTSSPQYNLEEYAMTSSRRGPVVPPQQPLFAPQEKFFGGGNDYRRASLAFPPSSKHVQQSRPIEPQRSIDESHMQYQFPPVHGGKRTGPYQNAPPMEPFENPNLPRRQSSGTELAQKSDRRKRRDRDMDMAQRRQSYGSPPQPLAQPPQPVMQQPLPQPNQLQTPEKVFGGDAASMIPARRSSVIYTPGPSPKELRQQQQQREQLEKQQALERQMQQQQQLMQQQQLQQQQMMQMQGVGVPNGVSSLDECETYISDEDEEHTPHEEHHQSANSVDPTASFQTYYSDSD